MTDTTAITADHILSPKLVMAMTSFSRTTLWRLSRSGAFPKPVQISENRTGYSRNAVEAWIASKVWIAEIEDSQ